MPKISLSNTLRNFKNLFDPAGVKKYVTQVSLILVSLFIATRAEKCRDAGKEREKLQEYLLAIQTDIREEIKTNEMNLHDCKRDQQCLIRFLQLSNYNHPDSLKIAFSNFAEVYHRGVFRDFRPTTFDLMMQTGDATLLKDLNLRTQLASVFAFRQNIIRSDLADFDEQTRRCAENLGEYFDFSLLLYGEGASSFPSGNSGRFKADHNEVYSLLRAAQLRGFHLRVALEDLQSVQKNLNNLR
jgi:hypothetical protein